MTGRVQLQPHERRIVAVASLVFAFATADVFTGGPLTALDARVRGLVQSRVSATPAWMEVAGDVGNVGVAAAVLAIAGLVAAQVRWRLWPLALVAGNFVAAEGVVLLAKTAVGRPGPGDRADPAGYPGYFPSGHTATAAVAVGTVVFLLMVGRSSSTGFGTAARVGQLAGLAAGVVAAIRAVLGDFHWLTDGLGGLAVAGAVLVFGFAAVRPYLELEAFTEHVTEH